MRLERADILYRILFSALILLSLLWLVLSDWPMGDLGDPVAMLRRCSSPLCVLQGENALQPLPLLFPQRHIQEHGF